MAEEKISIDKWLAKKITFSLGTGLIIIIVLSLCFFIVNVTQKQCGFRNNKNNEKGLEISTMIRSVKSELIRADSLRIANNEGALFKLRDFSMEISFTVREIYKGGAKVEYKFVTVEGGTETGNETVQKLILHWDAIESPRDTIFPDESEEEMIIVPIK